VPLPLPQVLSLLLLFHQLAVGVRDLGGKAMETKFTHGRLRPSLGIDLMASLKSKMSKNYVAPNPRWI